MIRSTDEEAYKKFAKKQVKNIFAKDEGIDIDTIISQYIENTKKFRAENKKK